MSKVSKNGHRISVAPVVSTDHVAGLRFSGPDEEPKATRMGLKNRAPIKPSDTTKRSRRRFTLADKQRILRLADVCTDNQQIGAILRREGIYKCTLERFMSEREGGNSLASDVVGSRKSSEVQKTEELLRRVALLERQNAKLNGKLLKAEMVIDFQKKLSQLLALEIQDLDNLTS